MGAIAKSYLYRMGAGIPGDISRKQSTLVEPQALNASLAFAAFGIAGKMASGKFVPFAGSEVVSDLYGFYVRPYPTQGQDAAGNTPQTNPNTYGDVMRAGYMTVLCNSGVPAINGQAYLRVASPDSTHPLGGVEASDVHTNVGTAGSNTGNGTIGTISATPAAQAGTFLVTMTAATKFGVSAPDGTQLANGSTGAAYTAGGLTFTITVGGTPMIAGDTFTVAVVRQTLAIPGCKFQGVQDANTNVEISYNI